jgi:hypothetical protein
VGPSCPDPASKNPTPTAANCFNEPYNSATPQSKTEACRFLPCGGGDQTEIAALNKAIRTKLIGKVWDNYFLVGTVWGKATAAPTGPSDSAGSVALANTAMETYFQSTQLNCFICHNSAPSSATPNPYDPKAPGFVNLDFVHSLIRAQQTGPKHCPVDFGTCVAASPAWSAPKGPGLVFVQD